MEEILNLKDDPLTVSGLQGGKQIVIKKKVYDVKKKKFPF